MADDFDGNGSARCDQSSAPTCLRIVEASGAAELDPSGADHAPQAVNPLAGTSPGPKQDTSRDSPSARRRGTTMLPSADPARYFLNGTLGEGGMGEVLLAHDVHIGREVAVKRLRAARPSAEDLSRFLREARVQGRLEHPALVPVHDLATDGDGRPFFVMKRVTGTTMQQLLTKLRAGELPNERGERRRLLHALVDVCLAVEFAHIRGVIHRDLKPANIMLGDFGEVYVLDWGLAACMGGPNCDPDRALIGADLALDTGQTQTGAVMGTVGYMAPEQAAGDRAGPAADIYALGCILHEIATGEPLHPPDRSPGGSPAVRELPAEHKVESWPELAGLCQRATDPDPNQRCRSARELGAALQAFLDHDRDLASRAELAASYVAVARAALEPGDGEAARRTAIRAAGRALALDPTATEAADLLTHVMLTPPSQVPEEVVRKLEQLDRLAARHQRRLMTFAMLAYLGFLPLMLWTGVRDPWLLGVFVALVACACAHGVELVRRPCASRACVYGNVCLNAAVLAILARIVGPFVFVPAVTVVTVLAHATHPGFGRILVVAGCLGAAVLSPWLLELAGVLSPTFRFTPDGELVLSSSVLALSSAPIQIAFALQLVTLIGIVGIQARGLVMRQREATRQLALHVWHLEQVVSRRPPSSPGWTAVHRGGDARSRDAPPAAPASASGRRYHGDEVEGPASSHRRSP